MAASRGFHVLVHGDETFEAGGFGLVLLLRGGRELRLAFFDFGKPRLDALLGLGNQALADIELAGALVEFLPALLQPLEDCALGGEDGCFRHMTCRSAVRRLSRAGAAGLLSLPGVAGFAPLAGAPDRLALWFCSLFSSLSVTEPVMMSALFCRLQRRNGGKPAPGR